MGQGLFCCDCLYYNFCNSLEFEGCSIGLICCGLWCCPPQTLDYLRGPGALRVGCNQGWGYSFFCCSEYCCAPNWMQDYSNWLSIKDRRFNGRDSLYDIRIMQQPIGTHGVVVPPGQVYPAEQQYGPGSNRAFR